MSSRLHKSLVVHDSLEGRFDVIFFLLVLFRYAFLI